MSFPITLATSTQAINQGSPGPLLTTGGNLYTVLFNTVFGHQVLVMSKSTDGGLTWNVVGGDGPTDYTGEYGYAACIVGTAIYVVNVSNPGKVYQIQKFDTVSDTWSSLFTSTLGPSFLPTSRAAICYNATNNCLYVLVNTSHTVIWNAQYFYLDLTHSTFSAYTLIGPTTLLSTFVGGILPGTGGTIQFVYTVADRTYANPNKTLYIQSLDFTNSLGTPTVIDTVSDDSSFDYNLLNCNQTTGATPNSAIIVWQPSIATPTKFNCYQAAVGTWTFSKTILTAPSGTAIKGVGCTIGIDNLPYVVFLSSLGGSQVFYYWNGSTYTTPGNTTTLNGQIDVWCIPQAVASFYCVFGDTYVVPG